MSHMTTRPTPERPLSIAAASALLLAALLGPAAASASPASDVEKYLNGLASWSADFTQTIDDGHGNVLRSAAGRLYLQRPGKFRWDYAEPSEQLILADGKQIWSRRCRLAAGCSGSNSFRSIPIPIFSWCGSASTRVNCVPCSWPTN